MSPIQAEAQRESTLRPPFRQVVAKRLKLLASNLRLLLQMLYCRLRRGDIHGLEQTPSTSFGSSEHASMNFRKFVSSWASFLACVINSSHFLSIIASPYDELQFAGGNRTIKASGLAMNGRGVLSYQPSDPRRGSYESLRNANFKAAATVRRACAGRGGTQESERWSGLRRWSALR